MGKRFPRPRGDGPAATAAARSASEVPPPTRGWPRSNFATLKSQYGSPAHAGMAPLSALAIIALYWFPRPRGDGPVSHSASAPAPKVPPPTRGWPPFGALGGGHKRGSPAHAGMAPCRRWRPCRKFWFPRPRGDGPLADLGTRYQVVVPPPTRGWPPIRKPYRLAVIGSPAHAGMAPA